MTISSNTIITNPYVQRVGELAEEIEAREAAAAEKAHEQAQTPSNPGLPAFMSPDSLVAYCDTRLTSIDSQMQSIFNTEQVDASTQSALSNLAQALNNLPQPDSGSSTVKLSPKIVAPVEAAYSAAIAAAGSDTTLGKALQKDLNSLQAEFKSSPFPGGPGWTTKTDVAASRITNLSQNVKTFASNLESSSQMDMIDLQSMMSDRQTAVQLSTNLLQALGQTEQSIAANFKVG